MGFLSGCGGNEIIDCPLFNAKGGWRYFSKCDMMIDNIDNRDVSKVCKCKRTDTHGILQHLKDKTEQCVFHKAIKLYPEYYLGGVEDINYHIGQLG